MGMEYTGKGRKKKKEEGEKMQSTAYKNLILSRCTELCRAVIFLCDSWQPAMCALIALGEIEVLVTVFTLLALIFFTPNLSSLLQIRALLSLDGGMSNLIALKEMFNEN